MSVPTDNPGYEQRLWEKDIRTPQNVPLGSWLRFFAAAVLAWAIYLLVATSTVFTDHSWPGTFADWLVVIKRHVIGLAPWPLITVVVFLCVRRFSIPGQSSLRYVGSTVLFAAAITLAYIPIEGALQGLNHGAPLSDLPNSVRQISAFSWFWDATLLMVIFGIAHSWAYYDRYAVESKRTEQLAINNERLEADLTRLELDLLRAQLEPHFLFNALNSITGLIRSSKTEDASDALASLSELLRYAIESGQEKTVSVSRELRIAEEYLRLQKLRFGDRLCYVTKVDKAAADIQMPPMLLQPMLENAVQYGMSNSLQPIEISIGITYIDQRLEINIENTVAEDDGDRKKHGFGLGLANIERRLDCLYPDNHTFSAKHIGESFVAVVTLQTCASRGDDG